MPLSRGGHPRGEAPFCSGPPIAGELRAANLPAPGQLSTKVAAPTLSLSRPRHSLPEFQAQVGVGTLAREGLKAEKP